MNSRELTDIEGITRELVRNHNQDLEAHLRQYLRTHRTTRLDIEVVLGEFEFFTHGDAAFTYNLRQRSYQCEVKRDVHIKQRLPERWRPALPGRKRW